MAVNVDKLQLQGPQRKSALEQAAAQIAAWDLVMPPGEPLVMDFGSQRFPEYGLIEYWAANECEAGYCGKFMFLFAGQTCPLHAHAHKHETFFILRGRVQVILDDKELLLICGDVLAIPTGSVHSFSGKENALILELSMPCLPEDNMFAATWAKNWHRACVR